MKLLSFIGSSKNAVDRRGSTYVYMDEGLESMIVRSTKGLYISNLGHMENSAHGSWRFSGSGLWYGMSLMLRGHSKPRIDAAISQLRTMAP